MGSLYLYLFRLDVNSVDAASVAVCMRVPFCTKVHTQSAQAWITQFYLQTTPCLPFLRERSPDGTTTTTEAADIQLQLTTTTERLSWPGWLTRSGWLPTQVVTHQLHVERRTAKARRLKTDVIPLDHATNLREEKGT